MKSPLPLRALLLLIFCARATAEDIPKEYAPLKMLIGEWIGKVDLMVSTPKGSENMRYEKTTSSAYDRERDAMVTVDIETDPWTKKQVTTKSEIRWDVVSKSFKAIVYATDNSVRLFVIRSEQGVLHFRHVDGGQGENFRCEVAPGKQGKVIETGTRSWPAPHNTVIEWRIVYSRKDPQQESRPDLNR